MKKTLASLMKYSYWAYLLFILIESVMPQDPKNNLSHHKLIIRGDYLVHFAIFLCIYIGYLILWKLRQPPFVNRIYLRMLLYAGFVAIFSEVLQLFTETRTFNWFDMLSNFIGIAMGNLLIWAFLEKQK